MRDTHGTWNIKLNVICPVCREELDITKTNEYKKITFKLNPGVEFFNLNLPVKCLCCTNDLNITDVI